MDMKPYQENVTCSGTSQPKARASSTERPSSAAWCISFLGIHPTLTQVPPRPHFVPVDKKTPYSPWTLTPYCIPCLKDTICDTITKQRIRMTNTAEYITNAKWKWAGHMSQTNDNWQSIVSTEWQIKGIRSAEGPKHRWRDDIVGQQGTVWAKQRTVVEGHNLEQNMINSTPCLSTV